MATTEYHGKYRKLFPGTLSSNSFLTIYVLHTLTKHEEMYGKEIVDTIIDRLKGTWEPSHGLLYPLLRNLEELGLVEGYWEGSMDKRTKRFYRITAAGCRALQNELNNAKASFDASQMLLNIAMEDLYQIV